MLVEFTMKLFPMLCFSIVIFATFIDVALVAVCNYNIIHIAMNSSSFPCSLNFTCCESVTLNTLMTQNRILFRKRNINEFVFQSGTHVVKKIKKYHPLSLIATKELIVWGQKGASISCADDSEIEIKTAFNITIGNITFWNCLNILATPSKPEHSISNVKIINLNFTGSHLNVSNADGKMRVTAVKNINFINGSLTLAKVIYVEVKGKDSFITCENTDFFFDVKSQGEIQLSDIKLNGCSNITVNSRAKKITIETNNTWFNNSCLNFKATRTKSPFHNISVSMINTKIEQCSCKFIQLHAKFSIFVDITLDSVTVTENYLPFIKSEDNNYLSVTVTGHCIFHQNKHFLLYLENGGVLFITADVDFTSGTVNATAVQGAPIYAKYCEINFEKSNVLFSQNQGPLCGGIVAESTQIYFRDNVNVTFYNNSGLNGGALSLYTESRLHFVATKSNITLYFQNNNA